LLKTAERQQHLLVGGRAIAISPRGIIACAIIARVVVITVTVVVVPVVVTAVVIVLVIGVIPAFFLQRTTGCEDSCECDNQPNSYFQVPSKGFVKRAPPDWWWLENADLSLFCQQLATQTATYVTV
jgi:hypothetical protein